MKFKKKLIILISSISILLLGIGISIYAYFSATSTKDVTATTNITSEEVITIASFDDLYTYSKASKYNDSNVVSDNSTRKILRLSQSVELLFDLEITADIHLDLNSKTINLNDNNLLFRHGYAGCFSMYGGVINTGVNGLGKVTIDLINASFTTNDMTYYNNTTVTTEANCLDILNIDKKYTSYQALLYVSDAIASDINKRVDKYDYSAVSNQSFAITSDKFIVSKDTCTYNNDNSDICSYVYKDLDLPTHYLSTDITISYTSSNESYLANNGKFTAPSTAFDVNLTATVNSSSWGSGNAVSCTFKLHLINLGNSTVKNKVAQDIIYDFLSEYYVENTLYIDENKSITNYYNFNHAIQLPMSIFDGNITYSYSMTDYSGAAVETISRVDNNYYLLEPNSNCIHLLVNVNSSQTLTLNMYSNHVSDYETIARLIINDLYGGSIIYDSSEATLELHRYSELAGILSNNVKAYLTSYNITNLTYSIKASSESDTYYNYSNYELSLKDGAQIPPVKTGYLTISFTFGSGDDAQIVPIDVYIDYLAESGDTLAGFLKYYNVYDPMVPEELTTEFEMPFAYFDNIPYTCYDVSYRFEKESTSGLDEDFNYYTYTLGLPDCLDVILYYNGQERLTFTSSNQSLTEQLNTYLTNNNLKLSTIASYGDAKYIFRLDVQNAQSSNLDIIIIYNYKFNETSEWSTYNYTITEDNVETTYLTELNISSFVCKGGLFYNTTSTKSNAIQDINFFKWIYNNFNPNAETITTSNINSQSFIPTDWLAIDVALDVSEDSTLSSVTNYAGIGNLTKITKVNLSGVDVSQSVLTSISSMTSVTSLNLSNCKIENITPICSMKKLKSLDITNNKIKDFKGLIDIDDLIEVYLYGNYPHTATQTYVYGSQGILNFQTYNDLIRRGISVYNQVSDGIGVLYADSDDYNDYVRLKSIIYQDKLSTERSIKTLYNMYEGFGVNNFGLSNTGGTFNWGYQTSDADGNTYTEYTATYFYVNYTFSNNVLTVKFYVDRY